MAWSKEAAYLPVWGDQDWRTTSTDNFKNYKGRFDLPNPQTSPGTPLAGGEDWYWLNYGNTRFIAVPEPWSGAWSNWQTKAGALMAQAQTDPNIKYIVTFGHRPAYSSGHYPGTASLKNALDALGDKYSKYVLNLNSHSRNYERSHPQHGVVHITAGIGGADLLQDGTCLWKTCTKPAWSAFRAMHQGALKLKFSASSIEGTFICGPNGGGKNDVSCAKGAIVDSFKIAPRSSAVFVASKIAKVASTNTASTVKAAADGSGLVTAAAVSTTGWTKIANEGASFSISGWQTVRYGYGSNWVQKTISGTSQCTNSFFGSDPIYGQVKLCEVQASTTTSNWAKIASEGASFSISGTQTVRYGYGSSWVQKTMSGAGQCTNSFFGSDPAPGQLK
jgi:hypothetical protein